MSRILSEAVRNARLQVIADAIDAAGSAGALRFYSGARVGHPGIDPGVTLLLQTKFQRPSGLVDAGVLTFTALDEAVVIADGTTTWARIVDSAGVGILDIDVGLVGSGQDVELDQVQLATGATVRINVAALSEL